MSKEGLWTWQNSFLDQVWHRLPLVIPGGVAGVLGALVSARSTSGHKSSSSSSIIILTAFEPSSQTSLTSRTSTMTLPSGAVILTIEVITSVQTLTPQATLKSHDFPSYSTTTTDFGLLSTSVVSATPEFASSTARASAFISMEESMESWVAQTLPLVPWVYWSMRGLWSQWILDAWLSTSKADICRRLIFSTNNRIGAWADTRHRDCTT